MQLNKEVTRLSSAYFPWRVIAEWDVRLKQEVMWLVELTLFAFQLLSMLCTSHDFSTSHAWSSKRERDRAFIEESWIWCGYWRTRVWWGEAVNFHLRVSEEIPYQLLTRSMSVCVCVWTNYVFCQFWKMLLIKQVQSFWVVEATFIIWDAKLYCFN